MTAHRRPPKWVGESWQPGALNEIAHGVKYALLPGRRSGWSDGDFSAGVTSSCGWLWGRSRYTLRTGRDRKDGADRNGLGTGLPAAN